MVSEVSSANENDDPQLSRRPRQGEFGEILGTTFCTNSCKRDAAFECAGGTGEEMRCQAIAPVPANEGLAGNANPQGTSIGAGTSFDPEVLIGGRRALEREQEREEASKRPRQTLSGTGGAAARRSRPSVGMVLEGGSGQPMLVKSVDPRGSLARSRCGTT